MPARWKSRRYEGLAGSLLVIAIGLLTLGLFVVALMATPRVDAAPRSSDRYSYDSESRDGRSFHWSGRLRRGQTLEVRGINGWIRAEATRGSSVVVDAEKESRRSDPETVKIEVTETEDGIRICALYPKRNGELNEDCESQSIQNNDVNVNYTVRVPEGVHLAARTVNGKIDVEDLESDVDAATVNGSIQLSTTGIANANTVNGSIHARIGDSDWAEGLSFETVNGSIALVMPSNVSADLHARSMNGHVNSDFPITTRGRVSSRRLDGTIGGGGPRLTLGTINGGISLRMSERSRRGD